MKPNGPDRSRWDRSQPVAWIAGEHSNGIKAQMAVDGDEFHLTQHDRLAYRPADHFRTISNVTDVKV
jgi:hypothetical protein